MKAETRKTLLVLLALGGAVGLSAVLFGRSPESSASARVPQRDDEILETLSFTAEGPINREVAALRVALAADPRNVATATKLAKLDIQLYRDRSDPRFLGYAEAALAPWWKEATPPPDVLVLRATIRQALHEFDLALGDLDRALAVNPGDAQAWITRAVVLAVRGRFNEATESCKPLVRLTSALVHAVCITGPMSLTGHAKEAYDTLAGSLARAGRVSKEEEAWARSSLGEYAVRAGDLESAEADFKHALAIDPEDSYVRGAFADLLLDRGRPAEVLGMLRGAEANDALLLRLAIAETRLKDKAAEGHVAMLRDRFDATRLRGDAVHRREESRFWLELGGDPARALALAKENWEVQKEPWDVRVYLDAALAANAPREANSLVAWLDRTKLEDPFIAKAVAEIKKR